ncbi:MAG: hypothetical protein U1E50_11365 [Caulobacteraceae bacterium]|jgi:sulfur relay (sulfurtransferase) DsrF/TusC family protein
MSNSDRVDDETIQRALEGDHPARLNRKDHKIIQKYLKRKKLEKVYVLDEATNEYVKVAPTA